MWLATGLYIVQAPSQSKTRGQGRARQEVESLCFKPSRIRGGRGAMVLVIGAPFITEFGIEVDVVSTNDPNQPNKFRTGCRGFLHHILPSKLSVKQPLITGSYEFGDSLLPIPSNSK
jgi:hypothetical protein